MSNSKLAKMTGVITPDKEMTFFHGTSCVNFLGIEKYGFRASGVNGSNMGSGIYFSDLLRKAEDYALRGHDRDGRVIVLFHFAGESELRILCVGGNWDQMVKQWNQNHDGAFCETGTNGTGQSEWVISEDSSKYIIIDGARFLSEQNAHANGWEYTPDRKSPFIRRCAPRNSHPVYVAPKDSKKSATGSASSSSAAEVSAAAGGVGGNGKGSTSLRFKSSSPPNSVGCKKKAAEGGGGGSGGNKKLKHGSNPTAPIPVQPTCLAQRRHTCQPSLA